MPWASVFDPAAARVTHVRLAAPGRAAHETPTAYEDIDASWRRSAISWRSHTLRQVLGVNGRSSVIAVVVLPPYIVPSCSTILARSGRSGAKATSGRPRCPVAPFARHGFPIRQARAAETDPPFHLDYVRLSIRAARL